MAASLGATSLADVYHEGLDEVPVRTYTLALFATTDNLDLA